MSLIKLIVRGISYSQTQSSSYALVLGEVKGTRTLPIIIGAFEAQSIVIALEKNIKPPRPLTHDLFKTFAERHSITIKQIVIHKLIDGVFFSSLICERDGIEEIIDARTSDAIALAMRFDAPIYTNKNILDKAGLHLNIEEVISIQRTKFEADSILSEVMSKPSEDDYEKKELKELYKELNEAIAKENYELAAKIRDEISRRS